MPETATLHIARPAGFEELPDKDFTAMVEARIREVEEAAAAERARTGVQVLGRRAVLDQRWSDRPTSRESRRELDPRIAARSKWSRIEALLRNRMFRDDYAVARDAFLAGDRNVVFPAGTYWMRRFVQAVCAPAPAPT